MSPKFGLPGFRRLKNPTEPSTPVAPTDATPAVSAAAEVRAEAPVPPQARATAPAAPPQAATPAAPVAPAAPPQAATPAAPLWDAVSDGFNRLAGYQRAVLSWVAQDGYPMNVDVEIEVNQIEGTVRFDEPAGFHIAPGTPVAVTGSRIHALPEGGFDGRSHVTLWGPASARPRGRFAVSPHRAWAWGDGDLPLPAAYERDVPKARRYYVAISAERGMAIRPKLPMSLLLIRATRAPFLSATLVPVLLGLAAAARVGVFDLLTAVITLIAASAVHLGLNVANDVFDTLQGADDANLTPTKFSGGSRVLQNALVTIREMSLLAIACYGVAAALGVILLILRGSPALVVITAIGFLISVAYTMPPLKLVYRGLGEICTAIGFGPVMLLGTYVVQSRGSLSLEAALLSVPVGLLVALILYVNEIPDRAGDASAGKRTLPVRWSRAAVIAGWDVAAVGAFLSVTVGVGVGLLPIPALLALLAIPLARRVHSGLVEFYDNPYALMSAMAANIQLHLTVGMLLCAGYLLAIADQTFLNRRPFLW